MREEPPTREEILVSEVEEAVTKHVYHARHNPALCPCPDFEVEAGENWVRVVLVERDADNPLEPDLNRFVEERAGFGKQDLYLIGTLDPDRIQYSPTGYPLMEFVLEGFTDAYPVSPAITEDAEDESPEKEEEPEEKLQEPPSVGVEGEKQ